MAIAPQVLPGRAFQQTTPNTNLFFHWRAQDRSLVTVGGSATGTLTRASVGGLTDGRGQRTANAVTDVRLVGPTADNQPRWGVSTDGTPHLLLEDTRKNWQPISNPSTGWQTSSAFSTGGATTAAPDGTLVTLLTDNSTTVLQQMIQDVEVSSTVAIVTWYTKWNGSTFTDTHLLQLRDATAPADRGGVAWEFGSTGAMAISTTLAGNVISAPAHIGNNWWKASVEATGIITGNDNEIRLTPARTASATTGGDMFIAHLNVESVASTGLFASSHIPTAGAAVTRAAETLSFPFLPVPQEMTVYCSFIESGTAIGIGGGRRLFQISNAGNSDARIYINENGAGKYSATHDPGTAVSSAAAAAPSLGDKVELRIVLRADGSILLSQSLNGGGEVVAAASAASALAASWSGQLIWFNSAGSAAAIGFNRFREIKIIAGTLTLAQCREAF